MRPAAPPLMPPAIALALVRSLDVRLPVFHAWSMRPLDAEKVVPRVAHCIADASAKSFGVVLLRMPAVPPTRNPAPPIMQYQCLLWLGINFVASMLYLRCMIMLVCTCSANIKAFFGSMPLPKRLDLSRRVSVELTSECTYFEGRLYDCKERVIDGLP